MPQVIAVIIAGAGIYAGLKWLSKTIEREALRAARQAEDLRRAAERGRAPKDLGTLERDPESGVYRPRTGSGA